METPVISYNLAERGRKYRGKERNFNLRAIAKVINGPECQERVRNRDMHGFYGHWTRLKYGMIPNEGMDAAIAPKVVPALVTTLLRASDDGTVEHQAEFLATDPGQVAAKLYQSRAGGFSSAIDERKPDFFGFDFVLEPNYTANRGYSLDDVRGMTLDDVDLAIQEEQLRGVLYLLDSANLERDRYSEVIEHLRAENEQLLSMLAAGGGPRNALDSACIMPMAVSVDPIERMRRDSAQFKSLGNLPRFVTPPPALNDSDDYYERMRSRFNK